MKRFFYLTAVFALILSINDYARADGHESDENNVFNIQVQLCKLNENTTMKQYDAMVNDYFKWSKKNDVEVIFTRQTALYQHDSWNNSGYDFLEILASSHQLSGKSWDLWLGTNEGQKLNERWQKLATCNVKMGAAVPVFVNENEDITKDKDRIVSWNWCSLNEGVTYEALSEEHTRRAKLLAENPLGIGAWMNLFPRVGSAEAPGDFAHIVWFPNIEASQEYQQNLSNGGWKGYRDYNENYATCNGDAFMIEKVLNRPRN